MVATGKLTADNVSVGKAMMTGAIYFAPIGTTVPTDALKPLDGFTNLGYVSDDGLKNKVKADTESIQAWGGDTVLTVQTSREETFEFTFIESLNPDVLKQVYGEANVDAAATVRHNALQRGRFVYVFEILLTGNKVRRIVVPNAEITEVGEITYKDDEAIGYECTLSAFPDENSNTAYEYTAKIQTPSQGTSGGTSSTSGTTGGTGGTTGK